ncbi:hypothetical protein [Amycolatopsis cihanbeyliensis]|uniref:Uncharacterized protein n=1 Tax=Amycolatopsis cihanbeyliensis TaxID=1128664 RepID=A0A542DHN8_AMYCI|nr:hypothetical protein [Amycolatopsis cihanbeyliensis]TQJ02591.1 hypothetical protein FB471_2324 [Amycolatopsis cihanbeyliensis]
MGYTVSRQAVVTKLGIAGVIAVAGLTLAMLFGGGARPAAAADHEPVTAQQQTQHSEWAARDGSGETRAIIVGGLAFVVMIGAAGAVLWFTARDRNQ